MPLDGTPVWPPVAVVILVTTPALPERICAVQVQRVGVNPSKTLACTACVPPRSTGTLFWMMQKQDTLGCVACYQRCRSKNTVQ